jgi:hypothetical protein
MPRIVRRKPAKSSKSEAKPKTTTQAKARTSKVTIAPISVAGSPTKFRARVRMYRQGLGDCFLLTFPRESKHPFHMLIDCGALGRDKQFMTGIVEHIRDTVRADNGGGKARLDLVVATHEHKDHLSGFNQAREVFNNDFDIGAVWLGWTENLSKPEIKAIKQAKKKAVAKLQAALTSPLAASPALQGVAQVLGFSEDEDSTGAGRIAEALEYLKLRGKAAENVQYLKPGGAPLELDGVEGLRVYVLGPPEDPSLLKTSKVTEELKSQDVIYHLAAIGDAGMDSLGAAVATLTGATGGDGERYFPFSDEHRIPRSVPNQYGRAGPSPYFAIIKDFVLKTYDDPAQSWRQIEDDWLAAFGELALDLDNDTNNTSLVLAFEFVKKGEVLLFVGDAQVGNWQSWERVQFNVPGCPRPLPALELLGRTVFYKVGHHCSHNATLKKGGLELMNRDDLVAFIPLDEATARKQGTKGWEMPAPALLKVLREKTAERVAISDVNERLNDKAYKAGIRATDTYIDYFLE